LRASDLIKRDNNLSHLSVGVFVDMQNIYYGAKNALKRRVDFKNLLQVAVRGRSLYRAIAYLVDLERVNQDGFIHVLRSIGYEIKLKKIL